MKVKGYVEWKWSEQQERGFDWDYRAQLNGLYSVRMAEGTQTGKAQ